MWTQFCARLHTPPKVGNPWEAPAMTCRVQCAYDLYKSLDDGSNIHVCMSPKERGHFIAQLLDEGAYSVLKVFHAYTQIYYMRVHIHSNTQAVSYTPRY